MHTSLLFIVYYVLEGNKMTQIIAMIVAVLLAIGGLQRSPAQQPDSIPTAATEQATRLTAKQAEDIALQHAGLRAETVTALRSVFDWDDGRPEWEVDFRVGRTEYEYTIHAETGRILEWDRDYD